MKLEQVHVEICRLLLRPGQAKRIPLDVSRRMCGYVIACRCGRANFVSPINDDTISEAAGVLTDARFRCDACGAVTVIRSGEFCP